MGTQIEEFLLSVICLAITNYAGRAKSFRKKPNRTDGPLINEIYEFCKQKMRSSYDNIEFEADATGENDHSQNDKNNKIKIAGLFSQTIMLLNKVNNHRFLTQLKAFLRQKAEKLSLTFFTKTKSTRKRRRTWDISSQQPSSSVHLRSTVCTNYGCCKIREELSCVKIENDELKTKNKLLEDELKSIRDDLDTSRTSALSQHLSQVRIKGSQSMVLNSDENSLFTTTGFGNQITYSLRMMLLGISILIVNNCPARQIPALLAITFQSAGFDQPRLPKYNFFRRLRFMLPTLNDHLILLFLSEAINLSIGFDETSFSTRMGTILGITMTNENGQSILIGLLENEKRSLIRGEKSTNDADCIIEHLRELCGDSEKFKDIVAKISTVLTDNCNTAVAGSQKLAQKLDEISPNQSPRKTVRCVVHLCALLEKHVMSHLKLLTPFAKKVAYHLSKPSGQSKDSLHDLWTRKSNRQFKHSVGERFFFITDNVLVSFLDYEKLSSFVNENKSSSNGAKQIRELMKNSNLKTEMLLMSGLAALIRKLWKTLTVKRTKHSLAQKIEELKENLHALRSGDISILQMIEDAEINDELAAAARDMFLQKADEDIAIQAKNIYIDIVNQMMPYLNAFLIVEEGTENHIVDPTNIPAERAFGVFKFIEQHLVNLQFGLISATTIAKFNHLATEIENYDSDLIWDAHSQINDIEKKLKAKHTAQINFRVEFAESMRIEVHVLFEPICGLKCY